MRFWKVESSNGIFWMHYLGTKSWIKDWLSEFLRWYCFRYCGFIPKFGLILSSIWIYSKFVELSSQNLSVRLQHASVLFRNIFFIAQFRVIRTKYNKHSMSTSSHSCISMKWIYYSQVVTHTPTSSSSSICMYKKHFIYCTFFHFQAL